MPGSRIIRQRRIPASSASRTRARSSLPTPSIMPEGYSVSVFIVLGVPRMCIRMHVQPSFAIVGSISESIWPAETSLMMLAPAVIAAAATDAR